MRYPEDFETYSPESDDGWPRWKRYLLNVSVAALWLTFIAAVVLAFWAIIVHLWLLPVIAIPLFVWGFLVFIRN